MNTLWELLNLPAAHRLAWGLLHFLWQGALLAGAYAWLRRSLGNRSVQARYLAGCVTLGLMALAPALTMGQLPGWTAPGARDTPWSAAGVLTGMAPPSAPVATGRPSGDSHGVGDAGAPGPALPESLGRGIERVLPWLVAGWVLGVVLLSGRLLRGWIGMRRIWSAAQAPLPAAWLERFGELRRRMAVARPVRLAQSALIEVPTVIGWFRPAIVLPAAMLLGLTPAQVELILAHELAHVRRFDNWVNLFQVALETLLFYHPGVAWVSRRVREDRELCCDELAVAVCGDRLAYAQALTTLEELRGVPAELVLAAGGGSLLQRVRHILGIPSQGAQPDGRRVTGGLLAGFGLAMVAAGLLGSVLSPGYYVAETRILLRGAANGDAAGGSGTGPGRALDPYFVQTEAERIGSEKVLRPVIEKLGLVRRWSGPTAPGNALDEARALARLRQALSVRAVGNSAAIVIGVTSEDQQLSVDLARAVAEAYGEQANNPGQDESRRAMERLKNSFDEHENKVRAIARQVDALRANVVSASDGDERVVETGEPDAEKLRRLETERSEALTQAAMWRMKREQLSELAAENRTAHWQAFSAIQPDTALTALLQDLAQAEQKLASVGVDLSRENPEVQKVQRQIDTISRQIGDRMAGIRRGIASSAAMFESRADRLNEELAATRQKAANTRMLVRTYLEARKELESEKEIANTVRSKLTQEEINAQLPRAPSAVVLNSAAARGAVYPLRRLGAAMTATGSLLSLMGLALRWAGRRPGGAAAAAVARA